MTMNVGQKASLKMIESAALVELGRALAVTNVNLRRRSLVLGALVVVTEVLVVRSTGHERSFQCRHRMIMAADTVPGVAAQA
jgi:hypothetical protein